MSAGAAAAAAARIRAIRAMGAIVRVDPGEFTKLLAANPEGVVVHAPGGFLVGGHRYLTSYKGLAFYTSSKEPLSSALARDVIEAQRIWVPS